VFQGEREMTADNKLLGQFDFVGIKPAPRGVPQIEVKFDIDANGIVNVSAKDKDTQKEQQIRIQASGGLSDAEIQRMVNEAEKNADADKRRREAVEARNEADAAVYSAEKQLRETGVSIGESVRKPVEQAISAVKEAMGSEDANRIRQSSSALSQAMSQFHAASQSSAASGSGPGDAADAKGRAAPEKGKDDVVDADFEEIDHGRK
jgi:molecular chaperone DnaK